MKRGDKFSENFEKALDKLTILWYNTFVLDRANKYAVVVEQADTKDLKSFGSDTIRVRFPSTAPLGLPSQILSLDICQDAMKAQEAPTSCAFVLCHGYNIPLVYYTM